jgi:hypothetical protein
MIVGYELSGGFLLQAQYVQFQAPKEFPASLRDEQENKLGSIKTELGAILRNRAE